MKTDAVTGSSYSASVFADASDVDAGDTLTFNKVAGPAWLSVSANGALSGIPSSSTDSGPNLFTLRVRDAAGVSADLTLGINVTVVYSNGTWVNAVGGTWGQAANWNAGAIAEGPGNIADFSTLNLLAKATVTLDTPRAICQLKFGDTTASHDWTLNGSTLVLSATSGTPNIDVSNRSVTIGTVLAGNQGVTKTGSGALTLSGANTYAGVTTVSPGSGLVTVNGNQGAATGGWQIGTSSASTTAVDFAAGSHVTVAAGKEIRIGNTGASGTASQTLNAAGTVVNAGTLLVGRPATLNLNAGGSWDQSGSMSVAAQGGYSAFLNVKSGSVFTYYGASTVKLNGSQGGGASATLTIDGTFATSAGFEQTTVPTTGYARVNLQNGGTLQLAADVAALSTNVQFVLGSSGGIIDTGSFATSLAPGISGSGGLLKSGDGLLTLAGSNSYSGATVIGAGTLVVSGSLANGQVIVADDATLGGSGTIGGAVDVQGGGILAPNGTLTVNNMLHLAGTAKIDISKSGTTLGGDKISGPSTVTYGGALIVTHQGNLLGPGDEFQLFAASNYSGSFSSVTLPELASGLVWNSSQLSTTGTIRVRALPVAVADPLVTTLEDVPVLIDVLANDGDGDGDLLEIDEVTQGAHGAVTITNGMVTYIPTPNWNGMDSFSYKIIDNRDGEATAEVTVTVSSVNDEPLLGPLADAVAIEDSAFTGLLIASDADAGQNLRYTKVSGPVWLTIADDGTLGGVPENADVGSNDFVLRVTDAADAFSEATLHITVANTNDAPVFPLTALTGDPGIENQAYNASISGSATDVDAGDSLTYSKVSGPEWLNVRKDGSLFGVPGSGDTGNNTFTVRATDESEVFGETTLLITVATIGDDGVWTSISGGSWNLATNWSGDVIASGANRIADFSTLNLTSAATVTLDGIRTMGHLTFGDTMPSHDWTIATGSGGSLRLEVSTGSPVITVINSSATLSVAIAGSHGLIKAGVGNLTLSGSNTYTGPTTVNAGMLSLSNRLLDDAGSVTIASGARLNLNFSGIDQIGALAIGGTSLPAGTYSSKTHPNVLTGGGRLKVGTISAVLPPDLDSDQDGLGDRLELVLGTDAHAPDTSGVIVQRTGDNLTVTFHRDDLSEELGLVLAVEAGSSLGSWPQVYLIGDSTDTSSPGVSVEENDDAPDTITVTIPTNGSPTIFARVKVAAG
jgi:autotransporter-associated beta strand protein